MAAQTSFGTANDLTASRGTSAAKMRRLSTAMAAIDQTDTPKKTSVSG